MKKMIFLLSHKPHIRYIKRFDLLKDIFDITVIFWNKKGIDNDFIYEGIDVYKIDLKANQTNPLKRIPQAIKFKKIAFKKVNELSCDYLYVGNLDMLMVASKYKKKHKDVKVIYEIGDLHRLIIDKQKKIINKAISRYLINTEKRIINCTYKLVLTSMKFYDVYYKNLIDRNKVIYLPNIPDASIFNNYKKVNNNKLTIGFFGMIRYFDQLRNLLKASNELDIKVIIAGENGSTVDFESECKMYPNVTYLGKFDYKDSISDLYSKVDLIYSVYDASMNNVKIALPNKLYECIICKTPIIVAKDTYLSSLVMENNIGFSCKHDSYEDLKTLLMNIINDKSILNNFDDSFDKASSLVDIKAYNDNFIKNIM